MNVQRALERVQLQQIISSTGNRCIHCARCLQLRDQKRNDYMVLDFIRNGKCTYVYPSCHDCVKGLDDGQQTKE